MREENGYDSSHDENPNGKRRSRRIPLEAVVHYQVQGSEFINLSSNVSADGIFIRNFSPPPVGTELLVKVTLPADRGGVPVQLIGKVIRVVEGVGVEDRGMGVEFISVQASSVEAIRFFVNEVYGVESLEELDIQQDERSGKYQFTPRPQDTLRLQGIEKSQGSGFPELTNLSQKRFLWAVMLVLVGILLGGGLVLFFFLLHY